MSGQQYDVEASVDVETKGSESAVGRLSQRIEQLGAQIKGTNTLTGGLVGKVLALGSAYVGFNALTNGFRHVTSEAIGFQSSLEKTKIGLAAILSAVQGTTFAQGLAKGSEVFKQLTDDAIKSTATTQELFDIYQSIAGPILGAGKSLAVVREMTNSTVAAASALNVDFATSSREIAMMSRGAAGMHVKLFAMLHATNAIKEDAKAFNALTQGERIEKLRVALAKFAPAAEAYQHSWAGVTSTFQDIYEQLRASAFSPVFDVIRNAMDKLNTTLINNKDRLITMLRTVGTHVAVRLDVVFLRAKNALIGVYNHWGQIVARIESVAMRVREMVPHLLRAAAAWQAINMARAIVGTGVQLAGAAGSIGGALGIGGGSAAAAALAATPAVVAAAMPEWFEGNAVAGAAASGGGGAATPAAAALAGAGTTIAATLGLVTGAILVAIEQWNNIKQIFSTATEGLGGELLGLAKTIWTAVSPVLKMLAQGPMLALAGIFSLMVPTLTVLVTALRVVFETLGSITTAIYDELKPGFDLMWGLIASWAERVRYVLAPFFALVGIGATGAPRAARGLGIKHDMRTDDFSGQYDMRPFSMFPESQYAPEKRQTVINDFRGSNITVKQDFREADPDRVLVQMFDAIHRSAEYRTQSGYSPTLAGS